MKTTDGHELGKHGRYYTRKGEQVLLDSWGSGPQGSIFLVIHEFEGDAMDVELTPNGHREITFPYLHEYGPIPVSELYKDVPVHVVAEDYRRESEKVLALTESLGVLNTSIRNLETIKRESERGFKEIQNKISQLEPKLESLEKELEEAGESLREKQRQISEAEDQLGEVKATDCTALALIDREELGELRKRDFKLQCLEAGGVDNWEWFDVSLNDFREKYPS